MQSASHMIWFTKGQEGEVEERAKDFMTGNGYRLKNL